MWGKRSTQAAFWGQKSPTEVEHKISQLAIRESMLQLMYTSFCSLFSLRRAFKTRGCKPARFKTRMTALNCCVTWQAQSGYFMVTYQLAADLQQRPRTWTWHHHHHHYQRIRSLEANTCSELDRSYPQPFQRRILRSWSLQKVRQRSTREKMGMRSVSQYYNKTFHGYIPLSSAFLRASSTAWWQSSRPTSFFTVFAIVRPMVPVPQQISRSKLSLQTPAHSPASR